MTERKKPDVTLASLGERKQEILKALPETEGEAHDNLVSELADIRKQKSALAATLDTDEAA